MTAVLAGPVPTPDVLISPWLEELVRTYAPDREAQRPHRMRKAAAALTIAVILLAPWLLRLDRAAYPSEPEKQQALDLCSRTDPTFIRFFASDRATCYERLSARR